jgi:hypothetical protein
MLATPGWASWRERRVGLGLTHCDDFTEVLFYSSDHANGVGEAFSASLSGECCSGIRSR